MICRRPPAVLPGNAAAMVFQSLRDWNRWTLVALLWAVLVVGGTSRALGHGDENHVEPVEGFIVEPSSDGWNEMTGFCFGPNAAGTKVRQYVWEKSGKVWIVEDGVKLAAPLIDLQEEVGNWRDHGLLGFALDPDFRSNGYIYLLYVVDRHHLLNFGTPNYKSWVDTYHMATIGRLARYRAKVEDDFRSVDAASRTLLIGDTKSSGIPISYESHGVGSLVFAKDGSLLVSCGDAASFLAFDAGGAVGGSYAPQGVADGILKPTEDVGAFRSQQLDSLNGKILRINPVTGAGYPSNPFFDAASPGSARSKVWSLGLRNPFRFAIRGGSGEHDVTAGNPGVLLVNDVGSNYAEELNVVDVAGRNHGWPIYEGMDVRANYDALRPAGIPMVPTWRPMLEWRWTTRVCFDNINVKTLGTPSSPVAGAPFAGLSSIGGVWYDGDSFPESFQDSYYFADLNGKWIRNATFNSANQIQEVRPFLENAGQIVCMAVHPETGDLYYGEYPDKIHRVFYAPGGNQLPNAVASVDKNFGAAPLVTVFRGDQSNDPAGQPLTYRWDFGDGTPISLSANPVHVFQASGSGPTVYTVTLTVSDCCGGTDTTQLMVSVNNTPPQVDITSPLDGTRYPLGQGNLTYALKSSVSDAEDNNGALTYEWQTALHHNDHIHYEPTTMGATSSTVISPVGGDGESYYYRITLKVTDSAGLSTTAETFLYPDEAGTAIIANDDGVSVGYGGSATFDVLNNDRGAMNEVKLDSVTIVEAPTHGVATVDPQTGKIVYTHNGATTSSDELIYTVKTQSGIVSNAARVRINLEGGLKGEYFSDANFSQLVLSRTDPEVNFDWQLTSPGEGIPQDNFSVRWTGSVVPQAAGAYTFYLKADDGGQLWVDGDLVIDAATGASGTEVSGTINLSGGQPVPIRLDYHDIFWNGSVQLLWSGEFQSKEVISRHDLIPVHSDDAAPAVQISSPSAGTPLFEGTAVDLAAVVSPVAGDPVASVNLVVNGATVGSASAAPYQVSWTPAEQGPVTVTAEVTTVGGVSADSSAFPVVLQVGPPNTPPTASADIFQVYPGGETTLNVIANDLDVDGQIDPASVQLVSNPGQGTVSIDPQSGMVLYQHSGASGGVASDSFSYQVSDNHGAISNIATVTLTVVRTWEGWQSEHPGAGASLLANGDGDRYVDLLEFALGGDPFSGAVGQSGLRVEANAGGGIDAVLTRPEGIGGVSYTLQASADLNQWSNVQSPTVQSLGTGLEEVRYANVSSLGGLSRQGGFVRMQVGLNGSSARTPVCGWHEKTFNEGHQTLAVSLARPAVFGARADAIDVASHSVVIAGAGIASVFESGKPYYLEFVDGAGEGHRFDVDVAGSSGGQLLIIPNSPNSTRAQLDESFAGSSFVIRPHDTLGSVFDKARFHGSNRSTEADRVMFFEAGGYASFYLLKAGTTYDFWVAASDSSLSSKQDKVVAPGSGAFFIRKAAAPISVLFTGEVRDHDFVQPLRSGFNLIGEPVPLDRTPVSRNVLVAGGFTGGVSSALADLIYQWKGDAETGTQGYNTFYLLQHVPPYRYWTSPADSSLPNLDNTPLFKAYRATFLRLLGPARPEYRVTPGWDSAAP